MTITRDRIFELVSYDPSTGIFLNKNSKGRGKQGDVAGHLNDKGYRILCLDRKKYRAHHIAWFIVFGFWPAELDHIDNDRSNNRIKNLREATHQENMRNKSIQTNSSTGLKGAFRKRNKFRSQICIDGKTMWLGTFDTKEEAHSAYCNAAKKYFGEFAHG